MLAPNARLRDRAVPQGAAAQEKPATEADGGGDGAAPYPTDWAPARPVRIGWARRLKRVFGIDMQRCPNGGGDGLKILKAMVQRPVLEQILAHLGLDPRPPPRGQGHEAGGDFAA